MESKTGQSARGGLRPTVARAARRIRKEAGSLPCFSLIGDLAQHVNGVSELSSKVRADPANPLLLVQLVEALKRAEGQAKELSTARAAIMLDPTPLILGAGLRKAMALDSEVPQPSLPDKLAARAVLVAVAQLRRSPLREANQESAGQHRARALHTLARIALLQRDSAAAVRFAKCALLACRKPDANVLITLAMAYYQLDRLREASRAAELAIAAGSTLGYEIVVDCLSRHPDLRHREDFRESLARLRAIVRAEDRDLYRGTVIRGTTVARQVAQSQLNKFCQSGSRLKRWLLGDQTKSPKVAPQPQT